MSTACNTYGPIFGIAEWSIFSASKYVWSRDPVIEKLVFRRLTCKLCSFYDCSKANQLSTFALTMFRHKTRIDGMDVAVGQQSFLISKSIFCGLSARISNCEEVPEEKLYPYRRARFAKGREPIDRTQLRNTTGQIMTRCIDPVPPVSFRW